MQERKARRLGVWLVGARGAISTCIGYGLSGLRQGLLEPTGIATATGPLAQLPFAAFDEIHLGGHDIVSSSDTAAQLVRHGVLPGDLVAAGASDAATFESRIRPGVLDGPDVGLADLAPESSRLGWGRHKANRSRASAPTSRSSRKGSSSTV